MTEVELLSLWVLIYNEVTHSAQSDSPSACAMYERLAETAAAVHKPLERWIIYVLSADAGGSARAAKSHQMHAAALDALGFERLKQKEPVGSAHSSKVV